MPLIGPEPFIPISSQLIRAAIASWVHQKHQQEWLRRDDCRQTKQILPFISKQTARFCISLSRAALRLLTQTVTGHNTLNAHLHRMGLLDCPVCAMCGRAEETSFHFLCECDAYCRNRLTFFDVPIVGSVSELSDIPLPVLLKFIQSSGRYNPNTHGGDNPAQ